MTPVTPTHSAHEAQMDLQAAREEVTRLQAALEDAQAVIRASEARSTFMARMSHELRTPLNAMLGFAQLLRVDPRHPLQEAQANKVAHIERAGMHLLAMLSDVLDLSRIEAGHFSLNVQAVALGRALDEALALLGNQAQAKGLRIDCLPLPPNLWVQTDPLRLHQIIVNLLSNAIKYNVPQGQVLIEAGTQGHEVWFSVRDTGLGMHPEQQSHLFEPFNRLGAERSAVEGTGIGLVIVKRLLETLGGRIEVESQPGLGSLFRVWLPQPDADAEGLDRLDLAHDGPPSHLGKGSRSLFGDLDGHGGPTLRLLYAEDNAVNVALVSEVLRMRPRWQLVVASSGQEAIDQARAHPPDLLLLDMHLGDMSGLDVSDVLARHPATAHIPRLALSADVTASVVQQAHERGFVDYLHKPLDVARLLRLLDQLAPVESD